MSWIKLTIAAAVLTLLAAGVWKTHHVGIVKGRAEIQVKWDAEKEALVEVARRIEDNKREANLGVEREYQKLKKRLADSDRIADDRLREFQAAASASEDATTAIGAVGRGGLELELLRNCGAALTSMGKTADRLEAKIIGLQRYVGRVCLNE
jgi:cell division septum initiation protein DivIVA